MLIEGKNKAKKKARRSNSVRGTQRFTRPSQANGGANIPINSEIAIPKLEKLVQKYIGISDPYGFLTDLRNALGIPNSQGASKYGEVTIPKNDGSVLQASLRITNHNSDARTYITHNANYEYNLSILVRKNFAANIFKPHNDVRLDEFVYYGKRMKKVENPLSQIVNSIIGFLKDGKYNDTTGIAFKNTSPQTNNNQENINCNRIMNKKLIRLTESDLHRIVRESVNKVLNERIEGERESNLDPEIVQAIKNVAKGYIDKNHYDNYQDLRFLKAQGYRVASGEVYRVSDKTVVCKLLPIYGKTRNFRTPVIDVFIKFME